MQASLFRRRTAAIAAAAVMSVTAMTGSFGSLYPMSLSVPYFTAVAAESSVKFISSAGFGEGIYAQWQPVSGASGYNVYVDGAKIDSMLIRQYPGYMRADAVGLKAGSHTMKVVPVIGGSEDASKAAEIKANAAAFDRSGYGFVNGTSSGAYNEDGTLKSNALVVYVTDANKDTVKASVDSTGKGAAEVTGIQNIITAYKKGKESRPLCVRFIGNITDPTDMPKGDLMLDTVKAGITVEGIGNDTVFNGFGLVMKNCSNVEVRNIGFMNCDSSEGDDCGLQQNNDHVWVHNCDFFYGHAGSDADQVKGDGALDTKTSTYVTHSYNHFWDNGKCNLQGMKDESVENYITYHHNWYDHSDSRHPRIRTCTVHIYNNYYDGNAKYGVGVTMGASAFVENNFFRNCNYPMLISMQGSDTLSGGTFSGEDGGVIKSYGNHIEGAKSYVTYQQDYVEFDAYEASSRYESVPLSVKAKRGGTTYTDFDIASDFYSYTPDKAEDVPAIVTANAGRVDGGDLKWTFDNSVDDSSSSVNQGLKDALTNYKSTILAIGSGFTEDNTPPPAQSTSTSTTTVTTTTITTTQTPPVTTQLPVTGSDVIYCSPSGGGDGKTITSPTDVRSAIASVPAGGTIYLLDGTYKLNETILIEQANSGSASAYKTLSAYPGAKAVFDFSGMEFGGSNRGFVLDGSYWHFYGFDVKGAGDNGILLSGNNNKLELLKIYENRDTGLQISRYRTNAATIADWPSYNLVLNCTSFNNLDPDNEEDADGFAAKLTCGEGNVFDGCMSYNNCDDGWDLFAKTDTGPIGVVTLRNCIAFRNGRTETSQLHPDNDGNGFKLGGSGVGSAHIVENCLAFENLHCGFTDNNNPKLGKLINCTAVNNGEDSKPNFSAYRCIDPGAEFQNLISAYINGRSLGESDKFYGTISNSVAVDSGKVYLVSSKYTTENKGVKGGGAVINALTASDFISTSVPAVGTDFHTAWRDANGNISNGHAFETVIGEYYTMGYRFKDSGTVPPASTTSSQSGTTTTTATTTATTTSTTQSVPPAAGDYIHNFTENGTNSTFYTISGNLSTSKGTVTYNGLTLTQCLKMESATSISFDYVSTGTITLIFVEPDATVKIDGTKYTAGGDGIITAELSTGSHTITKADTANLFYMIFDPDPTICPPPEGLPGDANCDGTVDIADAVLIMQSLSNPNKYGLKGSHENHLTDKGSDLGDVFERGSGITNQDALSIQTYLLGLLDSLPESYQ